MNFYKIKNNNVICNKFKQFSNILLHLKNLKVIANN